MQKTISKLNTSDVTEGTENPGDPVEPNQYESFDGDKKYIFVVGENEWGAEVCKVSVEIMEVMDHGVFEIKEISYEELKSRELIVSEKINEGGSIIYCDIAQKNAETVRNQALDIIRPEVLLPDDALNSATEAELITNIFGHVKAWSSNIFVRRDREKLKLGSVSDIELERDEVLSGVTTAITGNESNTVYLNDDNKSYWQSLFGYSD